MLPAVIRRWRRGQNRALALVGAGNSGARAITALTRSVRLALQIAMLAIGAVLVINHEVSAGTMICATIVKGRMLHPLDQMIEGWRHWSNAISALGRLRDLLSKHQAQRGTSQFTAEEGTILGRPTQLRAARLGPADPAQRHLRARARRGARHHRPVRLRQVDAGAAAGRRVASDRGRHLARRPQRLCVGARKLRPPGRLSAAEPVAARWLRAREHRAAERVRCGGRDRRRQAGGRARDDRPPAARL